MEKAKDHQVSIATAFVALYVRAGGIAKLLGVPYVHSSFPKLGLPVWFGYFNGVCEVLGSIGLLMPPLSALAAMGIGIIMVGATYYHATYTPIFRLLQPSFLQSSAPTYSLRGGQIFSNSAERPVSIACDRRPLDFILHMCRVRPNSTNSVSGLRWAPPFALWSRYMV